VRDQPPSKVSRARSPRQLHPQGQHYPATHHALPPATALRSARSIPHSRSHPTPHYPTPHAGGIFVASLAGKSLDTSAGFAVLLGGALGADEAGVSLPARSEPVPLPAPDAPPRHLTRAVVGFTQSPSRVRKPLASIRSTAACAALAHKPVLNPTRSRDSAIPHGYPYSRIATIPSIASRSSTAGGCPLTPNRSCNRRLTSSAENSQSTPISFSGTPSTTRSRKTTRS
jgi:hypothetical protein